MKTKDTTTEAAGTPAKSSDPLVLVEITPEGNGIEIDGLHHAAGKRFRILESQKDALLKMDPKPIKFVGV
jgi:hypothetical protein